MLFPFEVGSRLPPGSWWMEFQCVINGVLLYAQRLSGFTKDCEPLEGEAHLVSRPWKPRPHCQQSTLPPPPLPGLGEGGGCEVEDFPDSNCKAPHFDFPWWEERPGLCFLWLQPRLRENRGRERAHQSTSPTHAHTPRLRISSNRAYSSTPSPSRWASLFRYSKSKMGIQSPESWLLGHASTTPPCSSNPCH